MHAGFSLTPTIRASTTLLTKATHPLRSHTPITFAVIGIRIAMLGTRAAGRERAQIYPVAYEQPRENTINMRRRSHFSAHAARSL
jgi:hypothetical protein